MADTQGFHRVIEIADGSAALPPSGPCLMVIFGASGDLTKRLLVPALYNLACDGLLPDRFAIVGIAMDELDDDAFRERMSADVRRYSTRKEFDERYRAIDAEDYGMALSDDDCEYTWEWFQEVRRLYSRAAEAGRYVLFTADQ